MTSGKVKTRLIVLLIWIVFASIAALSLKYFFVPKIEEVKREANVKAQKELVESTSNHQRFTREISVYLDDFSGFLIPRTQEFKNQLASHGIGLQIHSDPDAIARINALNSGEAQFAFFPIDSLLAASSKLGKLPASIIALCDETKGADAIIGYKDKYPNKLDSLKTTKFVYTSNSPSEFLTKVIRTHFDLSNISTPLSLNGPKEVYEVWKNSKPSDDMAYVLYQPYVSKVLDNPNMHIIVDSSRFRGYIVDAIVVNRDLLSKDPELCLIFLESYFKALYENKKNMVTVVRADAAASGSPLSVDGIWWKNVQENYAHMGLKSGHSLMHVEDMINQINIVLQKSDSSYVDPTNGQFNKLYNDTILASLRDKNFHPGEDEIRAEVELKSLNDDEWKKLDPVGTLQVPDLTFTRGSSKLTSSSMDILKNLVKNLDTWPTYYLSIIPSATSIGSNLEANKAKAKERAQVVVDYLISEGVSKNRIKVSDKIELDGASVSFVLGQLPY